MLDGSIVAVVGEMAPGPMLEGLPEAGLELGLGLPFPFSLYVPLLPPWLPLVGLEGAGVFDVIGVGGVTGGGVGLVLEGLGASFEGGWLGRGEDRELPGTVLSPEGGTELGGGPAG